VSQPLVVAIVGPTGSGKSSLAIAVAHKLDGEIINCDSVQIFNGFNIGTAKLRPEDRQGIPHHLLDFAGPAEIFTAGDYAKAARVTLAQVIDRGKLPIVVGGTGFYLRALFEGLFEGPARDSTLREKLAAREVRRPGSLHRVLQRLDPGSASRIHANDVQKLIRALEVSILSRQPLSKLHETGRDRLEGYRTVKIGLDPPRAQLYERLNARSRKMFEIGLREEVYSLLESGVPPDAKPFESIGYSQALALLAGNISLDQAIESTQIATRHYAKRQLTWFRKEENIFWINDFGESLSALELAISEVTTFR
jgi:tRNA dimethylallyltransferase